MLSGNWTITLVERDAALAAAARQWLPEAALMVEDVTRITTLPPHDLVIAAYSLGEIAEAIAARLWQAARVALVVIEPGTPRGYALILKVREQLLEAGACMAAPAPPRRRARWPCPTGAISRRASSARPSTAVSKMRNWVMKMKSSVTSRWRASRWNCPHRASSGARGSARA